MGVRNHDIGILLFIVFCTLITKCLCLILNAVQSLQFVMSKQTQLSGCNFVNACVTPDRSKIEFPRFLSFRILVIVFVLRDLLVLSVNRNGKQHCSLNVYLYAMIRSYSNRLNTFHLHSLQFRQLLNNLVLCHKLLHDNFESSIL